MAQHAEAARGGDGIHHYVEPLLFLAIGLFALVSRVRMIKRFRAKALPEEQLRAQRAAFESGAAVLVSSALLLICLVSAVQSALARSPSGWLWILAAVAQVGCLVLRWWGRSQRGVFDEREPLRDRQQLGRHAFVLALVFLACLLAAEPLAQHARGEGNNILRVAAAILLVLSLLGFVAAGWLAVWKR